MFQVTVNQNFTFGRNTFCFALIIWLGIKHQVSIHLSTLEMSQLEWQKLWSVVNHSAALPNWHPAEFVLQPEHNPMVLINSFSRDERQVAVLTEITPSSNPVCLSVVHFVLYSIAPSGKLLSPWKCGWSPSPREAGVIVSGLLCRRQFYLCVCCLVLCCVFNPQWLSFTSFFLDGGMRFLMLYVSLTALGHFYLHTHTMYKQNWLNLWSGLFGQSVI